MEKPSKIWPIITLCLLILVVVQFVVIVSKKGINYENFEIKGEVSTCSKDCFPFSVKATYSDIEIHSTDTDYGGILVAKICEDQIMTFKCEELDISKLPDFKQVNRPDTTDTFPAYTYINRYVESNSNKKIYFLYRMLQTEPDVSKWVYDDPLAIISFNTKTREVKKEGQLSITGLNVKEMHVSPDGSYLLIVDSSNPRYLPNTTNSNIVLFDLKNKTTKPFATVINGGSLRFLAWIDDNHFFYEHHRYGDGLNVTYRIGNIN